MKKSFVAAAFLLAVACTPGKAEPPPIDPSRPPAPPISKADASTPVDVEKPDLGKPEAAVDATAPISNRDSAPVDSVPADTAPGKIDAVSADAASGCKYERGPFDGKIEKSLLDVYATGVATRNVLILYNEATTPPLPTCPPPERTCPARQAALDERRKQSEESQRCVVARITAIGGRFELQSPLLPLAIARLSLAQAQDIAALTDVRSIQDAERLSLP
jgi:hypothetical protein